VPPSTLPRIKEEIQVLRRGRGLYHAALADRLGANLRRLCGIGSADNPVRERVIERLLVCIARLPADQGFVLGVSFGIDPQARTARFSDRVAWLASHLGRSISTALREIDKAELRLAEVVQVELERDRTPRGEDRTGWFLHAIDAVVDLTDPDTTTVYERRHLVATRDDLSQVVAWCDLANHPGHSESLVQAAVPRGGLLLKTQRVTATRFDFLVGLPRTLHTGQSHWYELALRVPRRVLRPHYVVTAELPLNRLALTVHFSPDRLPRWIRRVDGEPVRTLDATTWAASTLATDRAGQVHLEFGHITPYLSFGCQWGWAEPAP
jgi:hypothetical protein